ncbi:MAG: methyl-accepting chemotaxis protein [Desulfuromonadaceae bacterium]
MESTDKIFYRRKKLNLSVKRKFQMWLLVRILGVVAVSSLVAVAILYFYARQEISASFYTAHIQIRRVSDLLFPVMAAGACVSLLSGLLLALFLPQKLAGPVFRVQKGLEQIGAGDLTFRVGLRSNDVLEDLADSVNATTASLQTKIQEIKVGQQELDQLLEAARGQEVAAVLERQGRALERLRT